MPNRSLHLKLFRRQAVDAAAHRWLGEVQVAQAPGALPVVFIALLACVLLCIAVITIEVPERIVAAGVLLPADRILTVRAPRAGVISRLRASEGQQVGSGSVLLEIGEQRPAADRQSAVEKRASSLRRELQLVEDVLASEQGMARDQQIALQARIDLLRKKQRAADLELETREKQLRLEQRQTERLTLLVGDAVVSMQDVDQQVSQAMQAESAMHAAAQRVFVLQEERTQLEYELQRSVDSMRATEQRSRQARERIGRELVLLDEQLKTIVSAPGAGQVAGLLVQDGTAVTAGQPLMSLFRPGTDLQAFLYISADDAGRISPGQGIELQLRAFPYQLYGTLSATVYEVSAVPLQAENLELPMSLQGAVIEIRAGLANTAAEFSSALTAGATFRADVVTNRWTLLGWLLRSGYSAA